MKEAIGELNTTVIVVIAVAGFAAFFFGVLWPMIDNNLATNESCSRAICTSCTNPAGCDTVTCYSDIEDFDSNRNGFECIYKG